MNIENNKNNGLINLIEYGPPEFYWSGHLDLNKPYYNYIYNKYKEDMDNQKYISRNDYYNFIEAKFALNKISEDEYNEILKNLYKCEENEIKKIITHYNYINSYGYKFESLANNLFLKINNFFYKY